MLLSQPTGCYLGQFRIPILSRAASTSNKYEIDRLCLYIIPHRITIPQTIEVYTFVLRASPFRGLSTVAQANQRSAACDSRPPPRCFRGFICQAVGTCSFSRIVHHTYWRPYQSASSYPSRAENHAAVSRLTLGCFRGTLTLSSP